MGNKSLIKILLFSILFFGIIYVIIWILFIINGPFPSGQGIQRSDWLIFSGSYLSFVGTISITYMVIVQNKKFREIEFQKLRYSQLPYIKHFRSNIIDDFKKNENGYILDCPTLVKEDNKYKWIGGETEGKALLCPFDQIDKIGVYKIQNIGIGNAMKISLITEDQIEINYRKHLKVGDSIYFTVDILSLKAVSQNIFLYVHFYDIYNNEYRQKLICEFIIHGTIFSFSISQEQFEPELVKSQDY